MNKIKNVLDEYGHTWIIFANKKLSRHDKINAVNNCIALHEGRFNFIANKIVIFDIDAMMPLSEADYNSSGKED